MEREKEKGKGKEAERLQESSQENSTAPQTVQETENDKARDRERDGGNDRARERDREYRGSDRDIGRDAGDRDRSREPGSDVSPRGKEEYDRALKVPTSVSRPPALPTNAGLSTISSFSTSATAMTPLDVSPTKPSQQASAPPNGHVSPVKTSANPVVDLPSTFPSGSTVDIRSSIHHRDPR